MFMDAVVAGLPAVMAASNLCLLPTAGPILQILQDGQGELSAAVFQELSREWPVPSRRRTALVTCTLSPAAAQPHAAHTSGAAACQRCMLSTPTIYGLKPH